MLEFLNQGWVGLGISVVVSVFLFYRAFRDPVLTFALAQSSVFDTSSRPEMQDNLRLTYRGAEVARLSVATVSMWNSGRATLPGTALAPFDPLCVKLKDGTTGAILELTLVVGGRKACACEVNNGESPGAGQIRFDFLDPGDGLAVRVLHTGPPNAVVVGGTLKGVGLVNADRPTGLLQRIKRRLPFVVSSWIAMAIGGGALWRWFNSGALDLPLVGSIVRQDWQYGLLGLTGVAVFGICDTLADIKGAKVPASLLPEDARKRRSRR